MVQMAGSSGAEGCPYFLFPKTWEGEARTEWPGSAISLAAHPLPDSFLSGWLNSHVTSVLCSSVEGRTAEYLLHRAARLLATSCSTLDRKLGHALW